MAHSRECQVPEQAPPLASSCEGNNDIQVFLPFTSRTRSTHWRRFDVGQGSDACFAPSLLAVRASGCQGTCSLFGGQIADLSRFPQLDPLFQLGVSVDTFGDLRSKRQQGPGLVSAQGSFETFCPSRGVARDHTSRECHRRGPAELGEQLLVSISWDDVPDGAVRKRAVVQRFSWRHRLRALRKLLPGCWTTGRCVLMPGLSSVLEGVPNAKFAEKRVASAVVAPATALRSDGSAVHTGLAKKPTQLSHTVFKQPLTAMLLLHVLHETSFCWTPSGRR